MGSDFQRCRDDFVVIHHKVGSPGSEQAAYASGLRVPVALAVAVLLFMGVPALILGLAAAGPIGWIAAATALPLVTLGILLWLGWFRRRPDDGPTRH